MVYSIEKDSSEYYQPSDRGRLKTTQDSIGPREDGFVFNIDKTETDNATAVGVLLLHGTPNDNLYFTKKW